MSPPERRRQLHGWVSVEALNGWQRFAEQQGTNVTALMEAIGRHLAEVASLEATPSPWKTIVRAAQRIAGTRSSRVQRSDSESSGSTESDSRHPG